MWILKFQINIEKDGSLDFPEFLVWVVRLGFSLEEEHSATCLKREDEIRDKLEKSQLGGKDSDLRRTLEYLIDTRIGTERILHEERIKVMREVFDRFDVERKGLCHTF